MSQNGFVRVSALVVLSVVAGGCFAEPPGTANDDDDAGTSEPGTSSNDTSSGMSSTADTTTQAATSLEESTSLVDTSGTRGTDSTNATERTSTDGGTTEDTTGGTNEPADATIEEGLVVRYYLDDFRRNSVRDSGPSASPFDLPIDPANGQPTAIAMNGFEGVEWDGIPATTGTLRAPVAGSALAPIDGASSFTVQVVVGMDAYHDQGSRFFHVGDGDQTMGGHFDLVSSADHPLGFRLQGAMPLAFWDVRPGTERTIYTITVELDSQGGAAEAFLYIDNGAAIAPEVAMSGTSEVNFANNDVFSLGTRSDGARALDGRLFYVAIYNRVLDVEEIDYNVAVLSASDDTPL